MLFRSEGKATDKIYFEGGRGVKPVIKAASIRQKALEIISKHGNPETIVINKASLILPFDFPANYTEMDYFPKAMSPTTRIVKEKDGKKKITFAGISDSSVKNKNQGNINRSLCNYAPDMTHHFQEIIKQKDASKSPSGARATRTRPAPGWLTPSPSPMASWPGP